MRMSYVSFSAPFTRLIIKGHAPTPVLILRTLKRYKKKKGGLEGMRDKKGQVLSRSDLVVAS